MRFSTSNESFDVAPAGGGMGMGIPWHKLNHTLTYAFIIIIIMYYSLCTSLN